MASTQALYYMIIYWHHFAGGKGDGNAIGQSFDTADASSGQYSNSKATKEIHFSQLKKKTKLFVDMKRDMT